MNHPFSNLDEASKLRVEWLTLLGHGWHVIESSLKFDRPQSVVEEQHLLDTVKAMLQWDK